MEELRTRLQLATTNAETAFTAWKSYQDEIERYKAIITAALMITTPLETDKPFILAALDEMKTAVIGAEISHEN